MPFELQSRMVAPPEVATSRGHFLWICRTNSIGGIGRQGPWWSARAAGLGGPSVGGVLQGFYPAPFLSREALFRQTPLAVEPGPHRLGIALLVHVGDHPAHEPDEGLRIGLLERAADGFVASLGVAGV